MQVAIMGVQKRDLDTDREIKKDAFLIQMIRNSVSIQRGQLTRKISMNKYKYIPLFKELQLELRESCAVKRKGKQIESKRGI